MGYTREEKTIIWLDSFLSLDYARKVKISALCKGLFELVSDFPRYKRAVSQIAGEGVCAEMERSLDSSRYLEELLCSYARKGIFCITYYSDSYPVSLKEIDNPPLVLYCKGNKQLLSDWRKLAIVGSRRTSANILKLTEEFSAALGEAFTIVTGIADGADTAAIRGALPCGKIISVLANGFDHVYPECNRNLLDKIIESGLVVTEYPPAVLPHKYNFPVRNRIIAGLSDGVLVVSGGLKSGTRHTAKYAFEYGREVFAFPYNIGAESGAVCNNIIKEGGKLVENLVDISAAFGIHLTEKEEIPLNETEREILELLRRGEAHISELSKITGKKIYELQPVLVSLEMKRRVADCGGNRYCAIK